MTKSSFLPLNDERRESPSVCINSLMFSDTVWMLDLLFDESGLCPMWVSWNAELLQKGECCDMQSVSYLPQINESPTSHAVVAETMRRSKCIANENGKDSIAVTYDLAIAKIAMQIQAEDSPKYDMLFISLGSFHIEMCIFAMIGKYVDESGEPNIIV